MTSKTMIANDTTVAAPVILREVDAVAFKIVVAGVTSSITSPTSKIYKRDSGSGATGDLSSTYLTGFASVSGVDTIITKTTQNLKAGEYTLSVSGVVDGLTQNIATIPISVKRDSVI